MGWAFIGIIPNWTKRLEISQGFLPQLVKIIKSRLVLHHHQLAEAYRTEDV
jgi:hypothetical protein